MRRVLCVWLPHWSQQRQRVAQAARDSDSRESAHDRPRFLNFTSDSTQANRSRSRETLDGLSTTPQALTNSATGEPPPDTRLADRAAIEALAAWYDQFSPTVGLEESDEPESLLFDITGLAPLFQGEEALAEL